MNKVFKKYRVNCPFCTCKFVYKQIGIDGWKMATKYMLICTHCYAMFTKDELNQAYHK